MFPPIPAFSHNMLIMHISVQHDSASPAACTKWDVSQKGEQKTLQVQQSPLLVCAFVVMTKVGIVLLKDHEHE